MSQTSIQERPPVAVAGHKVDTTPHTIETRIVRDGLAEGINFGMAAVADATDSAEQARRPDGAGDAFQGVVVFDTTRQQASVSPDPALFDYDPTDSFMLLRKGKIWVQVEEAVAIGDAALFRHTAPGVEVRGDFAVTASANHESVPTGVFRTATTGPGLAQLEINLP